MERTTFAFRSEVGGTQEDTAHAAVMTRSATSENKRRRLRITMTLKIGLIGDYSSQEWLFEKWENPVAAGNELASIDCNL